MTAGSTTGPTEISTTTHIYTFLNSVKITHHNQHDVGSFSESLGLFLAATAVLAAIEPTSLCGQESEAPAERSRKPALSEVAGDPTAAEIAIEADSSFTQPPHPSISIAALSFNV